MLLIKKISLYLFFSFFQIFAVTSAPDSYSEPALPTFHYIFNSSIYPSYLNQLEKFIEKHIEENFPQGFVNISPQNAFERQVIDLIQNIQQGSKSGGSPLFHQEMIFQLRDLILQKTKWKNSDSELTQKVINFIDAFSVWIYTTPELMEQIKNFMTEVAGIEPFLQAHKDNLGELIDSIHNDIKNNPRFNGHLKDSFQDHHAHGDVPFNLFKMRQGQTKVIRTSIVIRNDPTNELIHLVMEEFKNYLEVLSKHGKNHLYVNLTASKKDDQENSAKQIQSLERNSNLSSIYIINLAKDNEFPFYTQSEEFESLNNAQQFKQVFIEQIFSDHGFYVSRKIDHNLWKDELRIVLDELHNQYFNNQEELTHEERIDFIEISYVKIIDSLVSLIQPDVVNISCALSADRGPSVFALVYLHEMLKTGQELDLKKLISIYFSPPIFSRNRGSHDERVARFKSAALRLQGYHLLQNR